jgi:hypothetical protein
VPGPLLNVPVGSLLGNYGYQPVGGLITGRLAGFRLCSLLGSWVPGYRAAIERSAKEWNVR